MTNAIITEIEKLLGELKSSTALTTAETDVESIGSSTLNYIKANGLEDLYQIATSVLSSVAFGSPWAPILAEVEAQATAAGKTILAGSTQIVVSMAQSDLLAAGKLLPAAETPAA